MTALASTIKTAAIALALSGTLAAPALATAYDPATNYIEQFSGNRGAIVHMPTHGDFMGDPAKDYIDSLQGTFRAEKRVGAQGAGYDGFQGYVGQFN